MIELSDHRLDACMDVSSAYANASSDQASATRRLGKVRDATQSRTDQWGGSSVHTVKSALHYAFGGRIPGNEIFAELLANSAKTVPVVMKRIGEQWQVLNAQVWGGNGDRLMNDMDTRAVRSSW
jgi:hypothetical protein